MEWQDDTDILRNGYARWELAETTSNPRLTDKESLVVPVFVKLRRAVPDLPSGAEPSRAEVIRRVLDKQGQWLAQFESDYLQRELAGSPEGAHEIRTVIFRPVRQEEDPLWDVLHIGPPIVLADPKPATSAEPEPLTADGVVRKAIVAVIDDAIGYLNARFRAADGGTRIRGVWVQSSEKLVMDGPADGTATVHSGRKLGAARVDGLIREGSSEFATYVAQNDRIFRTGTHKSTNRHAGHGTHVLDIAAGADPEAADDAPLILAVQLPPAAVGETSGRRLDPFIVMGLRWVVLRAVEEVTDAANDLRRLPLIVNISLGSLAGPKDGTSFLEDWLGDSMDLFDRLSGGTPMRVVAAYGNARRARLSAKAELAPGGEKQLEWRIQPDDRTPSFLELRVPRVKGVPRLSKVALTVAPPNGAQPLVLSELPDAQRGAGRLWRDGPRGGLIAAVYAEREEKHDAVLIAVAPTARDAGGALAPPGVWRLTLRNDGTEAVTVSVQVQRDDTPDGFRRKGRQSWLDHEKGWEWDEETLNYARPADDCPVTRAGSEVSFCGLRDPRLFFVGAATDDRARGMRPSRYSAEGSETTGFGPTLAAIGDDGRVLTGLRRAGVASGTTARMSGTSMAAPQLVRRLVAQCRAGQPMSEAPAATGYDSTVLVTALDLQDARPQATHPDSRLGAGVLPLQDG